MGLFTRKQKQTQEVAIVAPPPPGETPEYWQSKIQSVLADQNTMTARQAEIESAIADNYAGDNEALENEYARLSVRHSAANKVIAQYRQNKREAEKADVLAAFAHYVGQYTPTRAALLAFEADEWPEIERKYKDGLKQRSDQRAKLETIKIEATRRGAEMNRAFSDDPAAVADLTAKQKAITSAIEGWESIYLPPNTPQIRPVILANEEAIS